MTAVYARAGEANSALLYERAKKVMPGGCSRNTILRSPHPYYASFGKGCRLTDIEGIERIDFANNMASLIHGHSSEPVINAVSEQLKKGIAYTLGTEIEIQYAEHMVSRSEGFDKIRFVNSGTEGVMSCIKAARAFTGRPKIAKTEGAYHGLYDYAEVSQTSSPDNWGDVSHPVSTPVVHGTPQSALQDVIVIPFNDPERAIAILDEYKEELACVLVDLLPHRIGVIPAQESFVRALRDWTTKHSALLVCDEVITFRMTYGGAQEWYGVNADLTAMGKLIGGGFPVGAIAGRADVMDVLNPYAAPVLFPHSGTFSANPVTMTAGLVAMQLYDRKAVRKLNQLGDRARSMLGEAIGIADAPACVTGKGSMFRIHLKTTPPVSYRDAYASKREKGLVAKLINLFSDNGILLINSCSGVLSTAMGQGDIDQLCEAALKSFRALRAEGDWGDGVNE